MSGALPDGTWLNVGSGPVVADGWTSLDGSWQAWLASHPLTSRVVSALTGRKVGHWPRGIVCRDVRSGLGVPDASAAVVYSSHFIEHLSRQDADAFLHDCYRALKPGGVCRIVTPDLHALVSRYQEGRRVHPSTAADAFVAATLLAEPDDGPASPWLQWYRARTRFETHKWLYDTGSLACALQQVGFRSPRVCGYLQSDVPIDRLRRVELRERIENGEGIVVEASK